MALRDRVQALLGLATTDDLSDPPLRAGLILAGAGLALGALLFLVVLYLPGLPGVIRATNEDIWVAGGVLAVPLLLLLVGLLLLTAYFVDEDDERTQRRVGFGFMIGGMVLLVSYPLEPLRSVVSLPGFAGPTPRNLITITVLTPPLLLVAAGWSIVHDE